MAARFRIIAIGLGTALAMSACSNPQPTPTATVTVTEHTAPATEPAPTSSGVTPRQTQQSPQDTPTTTAQTAPKAELGQITPGLRRLLVQILTERLDLAPGQIADINDDQTLVAIFDGRTWVGTAAIPADQAAAVKLQSINSYFLVRYDQSTGQADVRPVGYGGQDPDRCTAAGLPNEVRELWGWGYQSCPPI